VGFLETLLGSQNVRDIEPGNGFRRYPNAGSGNQSDEKNRADVYRRSHGFCFFDKTLQQMVHQDGDDEGILMLTRMPNAHEAATLRGYVGLRQTVVCGRFCKS